MARIDTLTNFLTDVATAIKTKRGDMTVISAVNFDAEILNLPRDIDHKVLKGLIGGATIDIEIPYGVTTIREYAFYNFNGLTSITIPNSVTSIGHSAFSGCTGLTSVTIPNSVTTISNYAFYGCTSLASITIPDSVTIIGDSAFNGCRGLTNVTMGNGLTKINSLIFGHCTALVVVDFSTYVTIPTLTSADAFYDTPSNLIIKVPSALLDEWKAATNWSVYADKIVGV